MNIIQEQFENDNTYYFKLNPGEYEGPLIINRKCVVDGQHSTLWARQGPVLIIKSEQVTIKNLRVEITTKINNTEQPILIKTNYRDTILEQVEVNGNIDGFCENESKWNLPSIIQLKNFAADNINTFSYEIEAADTADIINKIKDIEIMPQKIVAGKNQLIIKTNPLRNNTILYGEILVKSKVIRRIYITGKADNTAALHNDSSVIIQNCESHNFPQTDVAHDIIAPVVPENNIKYLKRGQRISIEQYRNQSIKIVYEHNSTKNPLEVDCYAFLLSISGKVNTDNDLIFFGNKTSEDNSVNISKVDEKQITLIALRKTHDSTNKISICYSIYDDNSNLSFSMVNKPIVRIFFDNKEIYRYLLTDVESDKTVVGLEIYRYKNEWKMGVVGAGYKKGLKHLCEDYGVNID